MTFAEGHAKRSVILTDRLGPDILLVLTMKRQVLHRERAHLIVPGCSLVLSALLTKKLPTFLSRLNEISGGCEKILPVSKLPLIETLISRRTRYLEELDHFITSVNSFHPALNIPGKFWKLHWLSLISKFLLVSIISYQCWILHQTKW